MQARQNNSNPNQCAPILPIRAGWGRKTWLERNILATAIGIQLVFNLGCVAAIFLPVPNVIAQAESREDAIQDTQIIQINRHLENTDLIADRQAVKIDLLTTAIAEMQGEQRAAYAFLGLLSTLSIGIHVVVARKKRIDA